MKSLIQQSRWLKLTSRKAVISLAIASVISGLCISPVLADNDDGYNRSDRHGNYDQRNRHENRGRDRHHDQDDSRGGYDYPYSYSQPVYVPPPVYYEPRQSPGISFFFPLDLRR